MFDIFEKKEKPKIYCCNIIIEAKIPARGKQKKYDTRIFRLEKISLVMNDGDIATENQKKRLFRKIFDEYIHKGEFVNVMFSIKKIDVLSFMSNVSYEFDYLIH